MARSIPRGVRLLSIAWRERRISFSARTWSQERDITAGCRMSDVSSASSSPSIFFLHSSCGSFVQWYARAKTLSERLININWKLDLVEDIIFDLGNGSLASICYLSFYLMYEQRSFAAYFHCILFIVVVKNTLSL